MTHLTVRIIIALTLAALPVTGCAKPLYEPAVAGAFYPGDAAQLRSAVDAYLKDAAAARRDERPVALIAPHAGYVYSGAVAGTAYVQLAKREIRTVILIGPSHRHPLNGAALLTRGSLKTPLGSVQINESLALSLIDEQAGIKADEVPFAKEHSLEVQLPFIQRVLPDAKVVPILVGAADKGVYETLSAKLATMLRTDSSCVLVVSTDLSHYHDASVALRKDRLVTDAIARMALNDLQRAVMTREGEMCGDMPVLIALAAARGAGATTGALYRYADSGDVSGDKKRVVGYAAMGLYRTPLTQPEKKLLLDFARGVLKASVSGTPLPAAPEGFPRLAADGAAFVTIKRHSGELRGCIGHIQPFMPLVKSVMQNTVSAALRDHRFPPVRPEELPGLEVEITVLSPMEPVRDPTEIVVGTHGVYLDAGGATSVFLPQVPVEQGWDRTTYLQQLARKAGLQADAWQRARLSRFSADVFN